MASILVIQCSMLKVTLLGQVYNFQDSTNFSYKTGAFEGLRLGVLNSFF